MSDRTFASGSHIVSLSMYSKEKGEKVATSGKVGRHQRASCQKNLQSEAPNSVFLQSYSDFLNQQPRLMKDVLRLKPSDPFFAP